MALYLYVLFDIFPPTCTAHKPINHSGSQWIFHKIKHSTRQKYAHMQFFSFFSTYKALNY